jgi:hypothetical protein
MRQIRKAEWAYINNTIMEGIENNSTKPFWKYTIHHRSVSFEEQRPV